MPDLRHQGPATGTTTPGGPDRKPESCKEKSGQESGHPQSNHLHSAQHPNPHDGPGTANSRARMGGCRTLPCRTSPPRHRETIQTTRTAPLHGRDQAHPSHDPRHPHTATTTPNHNSTALRPPLPHAANEPTPTSRRSEQALHRRREPRLGPTGRPNRKRRTPPADLTLRFRHGPRPSPEQRRRPDRATTRATLFRRWRRFCPRSPRSPQTRTADDREARLPPAQGHGRPGSSPPPT